MLGWSLLGTTQSCAWTAFDSSIHTPHPMACSSTDCSISVSKFYPLGKTQLSPLGKQILASSVGSATAVLMLNPINVVKVHLQTQSNASVRNIIKNIWLVKGISGFWSGSSVGLLQALPNTVLYMTCYEQFKQKLSHLTVGPGLAGGAARFVAVSVVSPLELIRTIQTAGSSASIHSIAREIVANEGFGGFYRGWSSSVLRDVPFSAMYWLAFEFFKPRYEKLLRVSKTTETQSCAEALPVSSPSHVTIFLSGATAGVMAAVFTHPFDVLKTQHQLSKATSTMPTLVTNSHLLSVEMPRTVTGNITVVDLYRQGGVRAMFRGLNMRLATVIPASGIMITVYEAIKKFDF